MKENEYKREYEEVKQMEEVPVIRKGLIVVISADRMGAGVNTLGTKLINAFTKALAYQRVLPEWVLLYNGGVKLACEESECLHDLIKLNNQGVKICTSGGCLDFYELSDKLSVGERKTMEELVEILTNADTIIRP